MVYEAVHVLCYPHEQMNKKNRRKMTNGKDDLHLTISESVHTEFLHVCLDERLKVESSVVEALMVLFIYDLNIRKRTKEEIRRIASEEGRKKLLADRERFVEVTGAE